MRLLAFVLSVVVVPVVWAEQVCLDKDTGALLEYQSHATPGTCTRNAVASGKDANDVVERDVTKAEWDAIRKTQIDAPTEAKRKAADALRQEKADALQEKLGLSAKEFEDLREALQ